MTRTHMVDTGSPVVEVRSAGDSFVNSRAFELLARAGFVARGIVYGIIGVLALDVAVGHGGKLTDQQGALRAVEEQRFGHVLLTLLAVGLGGYSLWRLFRAILGHGPEGADSRTRPSRRPRQQHRLRRDVHDRHPVAHRLERSHRQYARRRRAAPSAGPGDVGSWVSRASC